jgi:hypothetical protein
MKITICNEYVRVIFDSGRDSSYRVAHASDWRELYFAECAKIERARRHIADLRAIAAERHPALLAEIDGTS